MPLDVVTGVICYKTLCSVQTRDETRYSHIILNVVKIFPAIVYWYAY